MRKSLNFVVNNFFSKNSVKACTRLALVWLRHFTLFIRQCFTPSLFMSCHYFYSVIFSLFFFFLGYRMKSCIIISSASNSCKVVGFNDIFPVHLTNIRKFERFAYSNDIVQDGHYIPCASVSV